MRNLKKVMALALATVMLLGIMVMGAGAADYKSYKDAAQVDAKYELAVEMLNELGIFKGDNNGNLNAKNTLTRGEAAKVIATLKLTDATASKIGAPIAAPFADVAASDWYAPFVAYCKDIGIISGVGDNKFDPNGTLTGYAFAKMLLVAIGNKADAEGYTGASWDTNVNLGALKAKLLTGLNINLADAITREQAIQMAYNALQAKAVFYYGGGSSVILPDGTTINTSNATRYEEEYSFMASLYGDTYKLVKGSDKLGFTTDKWAKKDANGAYTGIAAEAAASKVVLTYTGKVSDLTYKKIYADAGLTATSVNATVYTNMIAGEGTAVSFGKDTADKVAANYDGATVKFINNDGAYIVLIEVPTLGTVGAYVAAKDGVKAHFPITGTELKIFTDDSKAYAKDAKVFYTLGTDGKVLTHKAATIVTGKLTEVAADNKSVTLDGTKYPYAGTAILPGDFVKATSDNLKAQKDIAYVVENGYIYANASIIDAVVKASLEGVYYVDSYAATTYDAWGNATQLVQLVSLATGEVVLEKVEEIQDLVGKFVTKADADKDKAYELVEYAEGYDSDGAKSIYFKDLVTKSIKTTTKAVDAQLVGATGKVYFTSATKILSITGNKATLAANFIDVPADIDATNATVAKIVYTMNKDGVREAALVVFKSAKALPANSVAPTSAAFYLLGTEKGFVLGGKDGKEVLTKMDVIDLKTFEKTEVLVRSAEAAGFVNGIVKDGAYDFTVKTADTYKAVAKNATVSLYNGWLTIKGVAGAVDMETANTVVLNPNNTKDADGKVITTVAQLVKAGKAVAAFDCELVQNSAKTAFTAVNYIIVK